MKQFVPVFLVFIVVIVLLSLAWPKFFTSPRPAPLQQINTAVRSTQIGSNTAGVLGVSDESSVQRLTPAFIVEQLSENIQNTLTDVIITHASRLIVNKFSTLPQDQQERILEALTTALNPTIPEQTQQATESSSSVSETSEVSQEQPKE